MSDSPRDNPIPGSPLGDRPATAAAAIECPQCGTQLRLLRPATVHTPIACCICQATFYLQPVETAPMSETVIVPRRAINGQGRPGNRIIGPAGRRPTDRSPRAHGDPPPAMSTPAPPPPSPGTRSGPGMPRPVQLPDHLQRGFRTRWMESFLGAVLVLLLVVAACAGGFVLFRTIWKEKERSTDQTKTSDGSASDTPNGATAGAGDPNKTGGALATTPGGQAAKALPRPEGLVGTWESRVDDGSNSSFVFRSDGTVDISQAGDPPPPLLHYTWYLIDRRGDELVLDIGTEFGALGNSRMTIRFAPPDAFTLVKTVRHGLPQPVSDFRYIRTGPPTPTATRPAAPAPLAPFIGPPAPSP